MKINTCVGFRNDMSRCVKCGLDMENAQKGFCSLACYNLDLQERINDLCKNDNPNTRNMT